MGAMPFIPGRALFRTASPTDPGLFHPLFLYAGSTNPRRWATPDDRSIGLERRV